LICLQIATKQATKILEHAVSTIEATAALAAGSTAAVITLVTRLSLSNLEPV